MIFLRDRLVLVTGAGGFIGSHLCEALVREGASVRALVHYNASGSCGALTQLPSSTFEALEIVAGDVRDPAFMRDAVRGVDTLFHLAALGAIPYSFLSPRQFMETNVGGTLSVLEAARDAGLRRVVHTSTSEVYGNARHTPMDEDHPQNAQSPYAASKIGADQLATSFYLSFDTPLVTVRPFNTYGPRQSARAFVPAMLSQLLTQDVVRTGDLDPVRDMNFVSDTVAGFIAAAGAEGVEGEVFHLGSGEGHSMRALLGEMRSIVGRECRIEFDAKRLRPCASEVHNLVGSAAKARERFGWSPRVPLADGLRRTARWVEANPALFRPEVYQW